MSKRKASFESAASIPANGAAESSGPSARVLHLDCKLSDTLQTYLAEAAIAGVAIDVEGCDATSLDVFDACHLQQAAEPNNTPLSLNQAQSRSRNGDHRTSLHPAPSDQGKDVGFSKKVKLIIAPVAEADSWVDNTGLVKDGLVLTYHSAAGDNVAASVFANASSPKADYKPSSASRDYTPPTPGSKSSRTKEATGKRNRRGKGTRRSRGGSGLKNHEGVVDSYSWDTKRLLKKLIKSGQLLQSNAYSTEEHGACAKSGWQGLVRKEADRNQIRELCKSGEIYNYVSKFYFLDYNRKPAFVFDQNNRLFVYRTEIFLTLKDQALELCTAIDTLLGPTLQNTSIRGKNSDGLRGPHFPCIIGHHRQYTSKPHPVLTEWHRKHMDAVKSFIEAAVVKEITKRVNSVVTLIFPGVAQRFKESAQWHKEHHKVEPLFGLFWNLCINGIFLGQEDQRIHCLPHADSQNVVGVCLLVIYQIPGTNFNHAKRSWLVLWESGIVIELPPWTILAYPSSLLFHFNIDVHDFQFVTTDGEEPTPYNSTPIGAGDQTGRGSLVYFNQATIYRSSELNGQTVKQLKNQGKNTDANYKKSVQQAFLEMAAFTSLPH